MQGPLGAQAARRYPNRAGYPQHFSSKRRVPSAPRTNPHIPGPCTAGKQQRSSTAAPGIAAQSAATEQGEASVPYLHSGRAQGWAMPRWRRAVAHLCTNRAHMAQRWSCMGGDGGTGRGRLGTDPAGRGKDAERSARTVGLEPRSAGRARREWGKKTKPTTKHHRKSPQPNSVGSRSDRLQPGWEEAGKMRAARLLPARSSRLRRSSTGKEQKVAQLSPRRLEKCKAQCREGRAAAQRCPRIAPLVLRRPLFRTQLCGAHGILIERQREDWESLESTVWPLL